MLASPSSEGQRVTAATLAGLRAMPAVLANDFMMLLCLGQQEPGLSAQTLPWPRFQKGWSSPGLEGFSLGLRLWGWDLAHLDCFS